MPKIQLIRRDSSVIELDAEEVSFSIQRMVAVHPLPIVATRAALDLNQTNIIIKVSGILADDEVGSAGVGASMMIDLSIGSGSSLGSSWYASSGSPAWATFKSSMDGKEFVFSSAAQVSAGLGEDITVRLRNSSVANVVAANSVINVDISSTTNTETIATAINSALAAASIHVNTSVATFSSQFTIAQNAGQNGAVSYEHQTGTSGSYSTGEKITITNLTTGVVGNQITITQSNSSIGGAGQNWANPFLVSNFSGGIASVKMTKGDKMQDLINMISNAHAEEGSSVFNKVSKKSTQKDSVVPRDPASLAKYAGKAMAMENGPLSSVIKVDQFDTHASQGADEYGRHGERLAIVDNIIAGYKRV